MKIKIGCPICDGKGYKESIIGRIECSSCKGIGSNYETRTLSDMMEFKKRYGYEMGGSKN